MEFDRLFQMQYKKNLEPTHLQGEPAVMTPCTTMYNCTALALLVWMIRDHRTSVYPVSATVVACGAYHLAIGIAKATAHHP